MTESLNKTAARLAVFGNPVEHSRSPEIHTAFGRMCGIDLVYEKVLVPEGGFVRTARNFMETGTGFNITVPCKPDAFDFVDRLSEKALNAQAVNTVSIAANGELVGDTTDGGGLIRDITKNLGWGLEDQQVLIIGAGGAVSSVLADVIAENPALIHLCNRTHERAVDLVSRFGETFSAVPIADLSEGYDVVINGTSAGLSDQDIAVPGRIVADHSRCYDMVYGPGVTRFNQWCLAQAECTVSDGLGMLVEQAALAFKIWFGQEVETAPVIKGLRASPK